MPGDVYPGGFYPGEGWIPPARTISGAGGIASSEAFGTPTVDTTIDLTGAGGIASSEGFGTPQVDTTIDLTGAGAITSSEAFGVPLVSMDEPITGAGGISSSEAFGAPTVSPDVASNTPVGSRYPGGFYPGSGWLIVGIGAIQAAGDIASSEAFGVPALSFAVDLAGAGGIPSDEAFGVPIIGAQFAAVILGLSYPGGFYPGAAPTRIIAGQITAAGAIPSSEAFGLPVISSPVTITGAGAIASSERFGVPRIGSQQISLAGLCYPGGFYPGESPVATLVSALAGAGGIPTSEAFGLPTLLFAVPLLGAGGIASSEAFGVPTLIIGISRAFDPGAHRRPVGIGCGIYAAEIWTRGGTTRLLDVPITSLDWARVLDDISDAQVEIFGLSAKGMRDCCAGLRAIRPWQHELHLYRDRARVWLGPIITMTISGEQITIAARDVAAWLTRRLIHSDHDYPLDAAGLPQTDCADIFNAYIADAMSVDPTPGLVAAATTCGVKASRAVKAAEHRLAYDEIAELARTGIDWTMREREMLAGGRAVPTSPIAYLLDDDFATPPEISLDGLLGANRWGVRGAGGGTGQDTIYGEYGPTDPAYAALIAQYGVLEKTETEDLIADSPSATAAARSRWDLSHEPPAVLTAGTLAPTAGVRVDQLVAGALVDIRLTDTCIPVHTRYRLSKVAGHADADGEKLDLTFQPVGTAEAE